MQSPRARDAMLRTTDGDDAGRKAHGSEGSYRAWGVRAESACWRSAPRIRLAHQEPLRRQVQGVLAVIDAEEIYRQLVDCGDDWVDKNAAAELLEETKKSVLAEIMNGGSGSGT